MQLLFHFTPEIRFTQLILLSKLKAEEVSRKDSPPEPQNIPTVHWPVTTFPGQYHGWRRINGHGEPQSKSQDTLSTHYLYTIYTLSKNYLHTIYTLFTLCLHTRGQYRGWRRINGHGEPQSKSQDTSCDGASLSYLLL